ncbi:MAG TPA: transglycosylase SLT domain-containing protein [Bryobacteraceae bacterium]|nr:transglycosylase SLT domain-containing protein [Bryobacteraceae bacterium]
MAATKAEVNALSAIVEANWSGSDVVTALAIAYAESGLNPQARGGPNSNGTYDWGLFQINDIHKPTQAEKTDAVTNAKRAKRIFDAAGGKFTPWATFNSGAYKTHLAKAQAVRDEVYAGIGKRIDESGDALTEGGISLNPVDGLVAPLKSAAENFLGFVNVGLGMILGIALLVLGVVLLSRGFVGKVVAGTIADMAKTTKTAQKTVPKATLSIEEKAQRSVDFSVAKKRIQDKQAQEAAVKAREALRARMGQR